MITLTVITVASLLTAITLAYKLKVTSAKAQDLQIKYDSTINYVEAITTKKAQSSTPKTTSAKRGRKPKKA